MQTMWKISFLALAVSAPLLALPARAAELTIFATGSMADPLKEVGEDFTHQTGHTLRFSLGTTGGVLNKLKAGEKGDVIVISDEAAIVLEKDGKIVPGSRKDVASSLFGVVVKAGAPTPDISTPEALKKAVLAARSISYPDPVVAAASGGYIESVFQDMGIKDEAKKKAALKPMGVLVGEAVAKGEAELGLSFVSEFVADKTLKVVMFPAALQKPQLYVAGVFAGSPNADAARAFLAFVTSPAARAKLKAAGVDPAVEAR
jgi:molybdate transport system substrate-binding protein